MEWYIWVIALMGGMAVLYFIITFVIAVLLIKKIYQPNKNSRQQIEDLLCNTFLYDTKKIPQWKTEPFDITSNGDKLLGDIIYAQGQTNKVAIITHGYIACKECSLRYAEIFYNMGYNVIIYDDRYFGLSQGKCCTMGYLERRDLLNIIRYAKDKFGTDATIVLHGESMGAVTSLCVLGLTDEISYVVADCPFADNYAYYKEQLVSKFKLPVFPIMNFIKPLLKLFYCVNIDEVSPLRAVKQSNTPILYIHGNADELIPTDNSIDLYQSTNNKLSEIYLVEGAKHAMSYTTDKERYVQVIRDFDEKIINNMEVS